MPELEKAKKPAKSTEEVSKTTQETTQNPETVDNRAEVSDQAELIVLEAMSSGETDSQESEKEKKEYTKEEVANEIITGSTTANSVYKTVDTIDKVSDPAKASKGVLDKSKDASQNIFQSTAVKVAGSAFGIAAAVESIITSITGATAKWSQWNVFQSAVYEGSPKEKKKKKDAPKEAEYALSKIGKGFMRMIFGVFDGIVKLTSGILMLIPGVTALVGGALKVFSLITGLLGQLYKGGKKIYQFFKGEKKITNSKNLLKKAMKSKDNPELQLILDLQLPSIAGSMNGVFHWFSEQSHKGKQKFAKTVGLKDEEATRIIDKLGHGNDPKNAEELYSALHGLENSASLEFIEKEIQETMTGFGT